jgi:hypothetical protein
MHRIFRCNFSVFQHMMTARDITGEEVTLIRVTSVMPSVTLVPARSPTPGPVQRSTILPPVTPAPPPAHLSPDATAAQSEAAFAVAAGRNALPPIQPGELPLPADPLPDLPTLGIAAPDPDAIAAEMARQKARSDAAAQGVAAARPASPQDQYHTTSPPDPSGDVPSSPQTAAPPPQSSPPSLAAVPR